MKDNKFFDKLYNQLSVDNIKSQNIVDSLRYNVKNEYDGNEKEMLKDLLKRKNQTIKYIEALIND